MCQKRNEMDQISIPFEYNDISTFFTLDYQFNIATFKIFALTTLRSIINFTVALHFSPILNFVGLLLDFLTSLNFVSKILTS